MVWTEHNTWPYFPKTPSLFHFSETRPRAQYFTALLFNHKVELVFLVSDVWIFLLPFIFFWSLVIFFWYIYCNFMLIIPWELNYNLWCSCTINWYMNWNVTQVSSRHCPLRRLKLSGCLSPLTPPKLIPCLWAFQFNSTPVKITAFICLLHRIGEQN